MDGTIILNLFWDDEEIEELPEDDDDPRKSLGERPEFIEIDDADDILRRARLR